MKLSRLAFTLLVAALVAATGHGQSAEGIPVKRVLFFSKSSGFVHDAIASKLPDGREGYAFAALRKLGAVDRIEFVFTKDGAQLNRGYLERFDAYVFYTSGDLTRANGDPKVMPTWSRGDGNPGVPGEGLAALFDLVAAGKGFVGIHSAADTLHTDGHNERGPARFVYDEGRVSPYVKMLGGEFIQHGAQQPSKLRVTDPSFPGVAALPAQPLTEEWYSLKNFAPDIHVILMNETAGMTGFEYDRPAYPSTWAHYYGKGRVFYTSLGHREDVWTSAYYAALLTGGLNWALGRVEADVSPNLAQVAPGAEQLPKYQAPPPAPAAK